MHIALNLSFPGYNEDACMSKRLGMLAYDTTLPFSLSLTNNKAQFDPQILPSEQRDRNAFCTHQCMEQTYVVGRAMGRAHLLKVSTLSSLHYQNEHTFIMGI